MLMWWNFVGATPEDIFEEGAGSSFSVGFVPGTFVVESS
jgi:hypothetical protein